MLAREIMHRELFTIREDQPVTELVDILVREHIHGVPVLNSAGELVGVVTQQDVFFSTVTRGREERDGASGKKGSDPSTILVRDLMTSPAVSASEETDVVGLCRMMHRLRIHRIPIVREDKVTGIISSLDIVGALANGTFRV